MSWPSLPPLVIFLGLVKLWVVSQSQLYPAHPVDLVKVSHQSSSLLDAHSGTFRVLERSNVSFLLSPAPCSPGTSLLVLALSALSHARERTALRGQVGREDGVRLVFLMAETSTEHGKKMVEQEHEQHGDILQVSDPEGYHRLAYKTLSGFVWTSAHCSQVTAVAKVDDDVSLDVSSLLSQLEGREQGGDFFSCPSVMRNVKPVRQSRPGSIMGKWSVSREAWSGRVYPAFCTGWLYVTSPRVALGLAEVAASELSLLPMAGVDDVFVSGILRQRLGVPATQLSPGVWSKVWDSSLSHCSLLGYIKNLFFNDLVLAKGSAGQPYVGSWTYFGCVCLESCLEGLEAALPVTSAISKPLWDMCART